MPSELKGARRPGTLYNLKTLTYALVATLGKHPKHQDSSVNLKLGLDRTKAERRRQATRTRPVSSTASGPRQRAILI
jgi:hypothetical protein